MSRSTLVERVRAIVVSLARAVLAFLLATFLAFALLDAGAVEPTWRLVGRQATSEDVDRYRAARGYDQTLPTAYVGYLETLLRDAPLRSDVSGQRLAERVATATRTSVLALLPGLLLGHLLALGLAVAATANPGGHLDRALHGLSTVLLSVAGAMIVIGVQYALCSPAGLNGLPMRGWDAESISGWLRSAAAPTIALALLVLGFVLRFDRAALREEMARPYIDALRGLGCSRWRCVLAHAVPNAAPVITARLLFALPSVVVAGSFLIESHFGIPGMGLLTLEAVGAGDRTFLLFVTGWAALLFVMLQWASDRIGAGLDPRRGAP